MKSHVLEKVEEKRCILLTQSHFTRPAWAQSRAMNKPKIGRRSMPVIQVFDPEVLAIQHVEVAVYQIGTM